MDTLPFDLKNLVKNANQAIFDYNSTFGTDANNIELAFKLEKLINELKSLIVNYLIDIYKHNLNILMPDFEAIFKNEFHFYQFNVDCYKLSLINYSNIQVKIIGLVSGFHQANELISN